jgi:hypothetical protein
VHAIEQIKAQIGWEKRPGSGHENAPVRRLSVVAALVTRAPVSCDTPQQESETERPRNQRERARLPLLPHPAGAHRRGNAADTDRSRRLARSLQDTPSSSLSGMSRISSKPPRMRLPRSGPRCARRPIGSRRSTRRTASTSASMWV